jgi:hypothetical protein
MTLALLALWTAMYSTNVSDELGRSRALEGGPNDMHFPNTKLTKPLEQRQPERRAVFAKFPESQLNSSGDSNSTPFTIPEFPA